MHQTRVLRTLDSQTAARFARGLSAALGSTTRSLGVQEVMYRMRFSSRQFMIGALIAIGLATSLTAAPLPRAGVFVYSSLCAGPEDASGAEIVLLRGPAGDFAVFTRTEGPIMAPLLAFGPNVKVDDRTGRVTLKFVDSELGSAVIYLFEGSITDQEIELSSGIGDPMKLPRITTFSSRLSKCRA